jgi:serpin B
MTQAGAGGSTAQEMRKVMHCSLPDDKLHRAYRRLINWVNSAPIMSNHEPAYQLALGNALWGQKGFPFRQEFTRLLEETFVASFKEVDFTQNVYENLYNRIGQGLSRRIIKCVMAR